MKISTIRFLALAVLMLGLLFFGLARIADSYGPECAALATVALLYLCLPQASAKLGAVATAPILTDERQGIFRYLPMAAATKIFAGVLGAIDTNGRAVNAADTAGLRVIGRSEETVDNSTGAAGDLSINFKRGIFKFANSAGAAITAAMVGKPAYVEDNTTVANTSTNKVVAGRIVAVDSDGVWVDTTSKVTAAALVATSTNGTAGAAADLAALKVEAENIGDDVRAVIAALNN